MHGGVYSPHQAKPDRLSLQDWEHMLVRPGHSCSPRVWKLERIFPPPTPRYGSTMVVVADTGAGGRLTVAIVGGVTGSVNDPLTEEERGDRAYVTKRH